MIIMMTRMPDIAITEETTFAVFSVSIAVRDYTFVSFGIVPIVEVCRKKGLVVMMMVIDIVVLWNITV